MGAARGQVTARCEEAAQAGQMQSSIWTDKAGLTRTALQAEGLRVGSWTQGPLPPGSPPCFSSPECSLLPGKAAHTQWALTAGSPAGSSGPLVWEQRWAWGHPPAPACPAVPLPHPFPSPYPSLRLSFPPFSPLFQNSVLNFVLLSSRTQECLKVEAWIS